VRIFCAKEEGFFRCERSYAVAYARILKGVEYKEEKLLNIQHGDAAGGYRGLGAKQNLQF